MVLNVFVCVALIVLVLLQKSDPASGGMFGGAGGTTQTVVRNPLARPTAFLAAAFLILSLTMAYLNKGAGKESSVMAGEVATPVAKGSIMPSALPAPMPLAAAADATPTAPVATAPVATAPVSPSAQ